MNKQLTEFVARVFKEGVTELSALEKGVVDHYLSRKFISRNINHEVENSLTVGQRVADAVASFGGSWTFISIFVAWLVGWVVLNSLVLARLGDDFDPYPYILLNLFLSMIAAIQAPIIMMSQNRQAARDRAEATHNYEVNLKSELEILQLHNKLDDMREKQWNELLAIQEHQTILLEQLLRGHGIEPDSNSRANDVY